MAEIMFVEILEQHVVEASFLWAMRDLVILEPNHTAATIADLDERLDAHLDGLRIGGDLAFDLAKKASKAGDPGDVATFASLAVHRGDDDALAAIFTGAGADPACARTILAALAFADPASSLPRASSAVAASFFPPPGAPPHALRIALAAFAAHRRDPGPLLERALGSDDARLLARAMRAAGELGKRDLLPAVRDAMRDSREDVRFWAAWSAALLGERGAARGVLWSFAEGAGPHAERACTLAARLEPSHAEARAHLDAIAASSPRVAIAGSAARGDAARIDWLLGYSGDPKLARVAAAAVSMITGIGIEGELAALAPAEPEPETASVDLDPDRNLAWPTVDKVAKRIAELHPRFAKSPNTRWFLGHPMDADSLARLLESGTQPQRAFAAIELAILSAEKPLAEVRARQKR